MKVKKVLLVVNLGGSRGRRRGGAGLGASHWGVACVQAVCGGRTGSARRWRGGGGAPA